MLFPFFFLPSHLLPLDEGRVGFPFSDEIPVAHLSLTAAQAAPHPARFKGERVHMPSCNDTIQEQGKQFFASLSRP